MVWYLWYVQNTYFFFDEGILAPQSDYNSLIDKRDNFNHLTFSHWEVIPRDARMRQMPAAGINEAPTRAQWYNNQS